MGPTPAGNGRVRARVQCGGREIDVADGPRVAACVHDDGARFDPAALHEPRDPHGGDDQVGCPDQLG